MNILRVIPSMDPSSGGPCQGIRNSIPALEQLGVKNEVVCLDDPSASFLRKDPFPVYAVGPANNPWAYSSKLIPCLLKLFARFDVVIVHGLWLYHSYAVRKALEQFKKKSKGKAPKVFVMPHGMLDPYFQQAEGRKLKALRNVAYWKLIESKVVNNADGLLFTCEEELSLARQPFRPYEPKNELNVGYGIAEPPSYSTTMEAAFNEKCPEVKGQPYLLFLSRIHEKKGVDLLIEAYAQLTKQSRDREVDIPQLVIAGPGLESSYGEKLYQMVQESALLKNKVHFPGMLTGIAKWGAFYGCEAFVLPSHQENFGIAVVEALACRKPVLLSNQVNIWREIEAAGGGVIANDTQEGTYELLNKWLALSANEKKILVDNARITYDNYFAIGPNVARLVKILRSN